MSDALFPDLAPGTLPDSPGANSGDSPAVTPAAGEADFMIYLTLPLQIGRRPGCLGVTRIDWKQFATSPKLVLYLQDGNGVPVNLTGVASITLRVSLAMGGGAVISEAMTLLYAVGGLVGYGFQATDVVTPGTYHLEVEARMADGSAIYFPSTGYVVFVVNPSLAGP